MPRSEQQYIALCKKQIERKFSFGNGHGHTQRDLELLSQHIEEKTGVNISLSTLKRLWKNDFKQSPQLATLNALSALLNYQDWQDFKQRNQKRNYLSISLTLGLAAGLTLIVITSFIISALYEPGKPVEPVLNGPVYFSAEKTVLSGIPNTVIFKYDVSNVEADSFFIQQTWNELHRFKIDPKGEVFSNIYYESGFHRARLIANGSIIAMQPIHILSDGWEPHVYYSDNDLIPIDFRNESFINDGRLHLGRRLLEKRNVDLAKTFYSRVTNSQEFDVSSNNFRLTTRLKSDSSFQSLCPWMSILVIMEKHIFYVAMQNKGCERYAGYKLGEIERDGENHDLSALGCDLYQWQEVEIRVKDQKGTIFINGKEAFEEHYKEDFGEVKALTFVFEGTGSLDYVELAGVDDNIVFEDQFDK